jgi:mono/diheme cytochrome c family protein
MKPILHLKTGVTVLLCALALESFVFAGAPASGKDASAGAPVVHGNDADSMRVAGEQRFRANCGRCHAAPQKFPPRVMGTILQHMRVRATLSAEDRRLILLYMTQ